MKTSSGAVRCWRPSAAVVAAAAAAVVVVVVVVVVVATSGKRAVNHLGAHARPDRNHLGGARARPDRNPLGMSNPIKCAYE